MRHGLAPGVLMRALRCGRSVLSLLLAAGIVLLGPAVKTARAELVPTQAVLKQTSDDSQARDRVRAFLEREDVRGQLEALGVSPEEAEARVASLTDEEIARIEGNLDQLPAGGDLVGLMVAILVGTILILLFADLLGFTDVFPFINPLPRGTAKQKP
jgi:hypothetical protein